MMNNSQRIAKLETQQALEEGLIALKEHLQNLAVELEYEEYEAAHDTIGDLALGINLFHQAVDYLINISLKERYEKN